MVFKLDELFIDFHNLFFFELELLLKEGLKIFVSFQGWRFKMVDEIDFVKENLF